MYLETTHISAVEIVVVISISYATTILQALVSSSAHLVENVEVSFSWVLHNNPGLLQQEVGYLTSCGLTSIEKNFNIFSLRI